MYRTTNHHISCDLEERPLTINLFRCSRSELTATWVQSALREPGQFRRVTCVEDENADRAGNPGYTLFHVITRGQ